MSKEAWRPGAPLPSVLCVSGSKVLEGFGRLLVLAVGPNSQQGLIQQLVMGGGGAGGSAADAGVPGAAAAAAGDGSDSLREATPLTSRLEALAGGIGRLGLGAALGVLAVNSGLYTAETLGAGGSVWSSASLEVRPHQPGAARGGAARGFVCRVSRAHADTCACADTASGAMRPQRPSGASSHTAALTRAPHALPLPLPVPARARRTCRFSSPA